MDAGPHAGWKFGQTLRGPEALGRCVTDQPAPSEVSSFVLLATHPPILAMAHGR